MKKIFVKPQVSTQPLNAESMLMASGDNPTPTVFNASATAEGTALSKGGSTFHAQDILIEL